MSQPQLVLASGSPRRRQLLEQAGYEFRVLPARDGVEEAGLCSGCGPAELVVDLSRRKLADVVDQLASAPGGEMVVLAADTVAECGGQILGKPRDDEHARRMLAGLSGREHRVYTGVVVARVDVAGEPATLVAEPVVSHLRMDPLSDAWIDDYVASGRWEGKAGGFGFQDGLGFVHVVGGSESNVVGLPMDEVRRWLAEAGCSPRDVGSA